jgi:hypothetical protein
MKPRFWLPTLATVVVWVAGIGALEQSSPRLFASWHGFLHAGIAMQFPSATLVPENPFFANEPLAYYWFYQWLGHVISRAAGVDVLHAFHGLALISLITLLVSAAQVGRQLYRSTAAGLLIGYLALVGMNPLGPVVAVAKQLVQHQNLLHNSKADSGGDVFVTNVEADARMARPLLGAMTVGSDWRINQDLVWFFDVSSRAPSIALLMVAAWLFTRPGRGRASALALMLVGAATAALNPIIGLAAAGALAAASGILWVMSPAGADRNGWRDCAFRSGALLAGAVLAWPTYRHLAAFHNPIVLTLGKGFVLKAAALAAGLILMGPAAIRHLTRARAERPAALVAIALAALFLAGVVPFIGLVEGNQHNLVNAASCLLAIPAAGWAVGTADRSEGGIRRRAGVMFAVCLPATICLAVAFAGQSPLPLSAAHGVLRRLPVDGPLDAFYQWASSSTPRDAVFITDPSQPVKMSGNVSEIPAFTGRALLVDHPSYLTAPYPDRDRRMDIARGALSGRRPAAADVAYLAALRRPLYVATFAAEDPELIRQLTDHYGPPVFARDYVAVFRLVPQVIMAAQ